MKCVVVNSILLTPKDHYRDHQTKRERKFSHGLHDKQHCTECIT
jgi:hypothetical protein